jgi:hypothetical protein
MTAHTLTHRVLHSSLFLHLPPPSIPDLRPYPSSIPILIPNSILHLSLPFIHPHCSSVLSPIHPTLYPFPLYTSYTIYIPILHLSPSQSPIHLYPQFIPTVRLSYPPSISVSIAHFLIIPSGCHIHPSCVLPTQTPPARKIN